MNLSIYCCTCDACDSCDTAYNVSGIASWWHLRYAIQAASPDGALHTISIAGDIAAGRY